MKTSASWSPTPSLNVVSVQLGEQAWTVTVDNRQPTSCPGCGTQSTSRHSAYSRTLRDLSAQGPPVIIKARLARWRCRNQRCGRRIFTEGLPGLAAPFARQTARLASIVRLLAHSTGGRPSERLMKRLGMPVIDTTILRSLKEHARTRSDNGAVHVAGCRAVRNLGLLHSRCTLRDKGEANLLKLLEVRIFSVASVMILSCPAPPELIVPRSLPVTACRRRHFAPRVNQTQFRCCATTKKWRNWTVARSCIPSLPRCLQMGARDCAVALVCAFSAVVAERTAGTSTPSPAGCAVRSPRAEGKAGAADKRKRRPSINRLSLPLLNEGPLIGWSPRSVVCPSHRLLDNRRFQRSPGLSSSPKT